MATRVRSSIYPTSQAKDSNQSEPVPTLRLYTTGISTTATFILAARSETFIAVKNKHSDNDQGFFFAFGFITCHWARQNFPAPLKIKQFCPKKNHNRSTALERPVINCFSL